MEFDHVQTLLFLLVKTPNIGDRGTRDSPHENTSIQVWGVPLRFVAKRGLCMFTNRHRQFAWMSKWPKHSCTPQHRCASRWRDHVSDICETKTDTLQTLLREKDACLSDRETEDLRLRRVTPLKGSQQLLRQGAWYKDYAQICKRLSEAVLGIPKNEAMTMTVTMTHSKKSIQHSLMA